MLAKLLKPVYAHCDVPCGIYETDTMMNAAQTALKMTKKAEELGEVTDADKHNQFVRIVSQKEEHAKKCKEQLYILWSDYFKPEHLEKFPDLHTKFWQAAKQCSKVKQTMSAEEAQKLVDLVHDIAHLFEESKA